MCGKGRDGRRKEDPVENIEILNASAYTYRGRGNLHFSVCRGLAGS